MEYIDEHFLKAHRVHGIVHIVALSGGKDSTSMALKLARYKPLPYIYICTPTGDELPDMKNHWERLSWLLGEKIIMLHDPATPTIYDLIRHMKMLPNWRNRWCTKILKIDPAQEFYMRVKPAIVYVGLRADEASRTGNLIFDEGIRQDFPLREWKWGIDEVLKYLRYRKIQIPMRTDCAMCFFQGVKEWWNLWRFYNTRFEKIAALENEIGHTLVSPNRWPNWPNKLDDLAKVFKSGTIPRGANTRGKIFKDNDNTQCRICSL